MPVRDTANGALANFTLDVPPVVPLPLVALPLPLALPEPDAELLDEVGDLPAEVFLSPPTARPSSARMAGTRNKASHHQPPIGSR